MSFPRPLSAHDLPPLSDEQLIAYVAAMRARGERDAAALGLAHLVYGHWENVRRRVSLRVPAADVDDVAGEVITSAVTSAFDGTSEGEFVVWMGRIAQRRIADYHRAKARRISAESLDAVTEAGYEPSADGGVDRTGYLEVQTIIQELLGERSPEHRRVVEVMVFDDLPASSAQAAVPGLSEANAYKIVSRFRRDLRVRLAERDTGEGPP